MSALIEKHEGVSPCSAINSRKRAAKASLTAGKPLMLWKPMTWRPGPSLRRATSAISCSKEYSREWNSFVKLKSVEPSLRPGFGEAMRGMPSGCLQLTLRARDPGQARNVRGVKGERQVDDMRPRTEIRRRDVQECRIEGEPPLVHEIAEGR